MHLGCFSPNKRNCTTPGIFPFVRFQAKILNVCSWERSVNTWEKSLHTRPSEQRGGCFGQVSINVDDSTHTHTRTHTHTHTHIFLKHIYIYIHAHICFVYIHINATKRYYEPKQIPFEDPSIYTDHVHEYRLCICSIYVIINVI